MTPHAIRLAGESVFLYPERAALWNGTLFVADVHLGKGDHFRARGLPLPPGELDDDLSRLSRLVAATGAERVLVLGDLIHGTVAMETAARVARWLSDSPAKVYLVPGNHDRHEPVLPGSWEVEKLAPVLREGPFTFRHAPTGEGVEWAGHVHPTVTLGGGSQRLRFPAFIVTESRLLLPAFSRFTGGPTVRAAPGVRRFVCFEDEVLAVDKEE